MFWGRKNISDKELTAALNECKSANEQGYLIAKKYLAELENSIDSATQILSECISGMHKYKVTDKQIIENIRRQLKTVNEKFKQSYTETKLNLEKKNKQNSKFNITLFGRTKAGKSTLMEILTHGDGSHMGKGGQRTTLDVRSYDWQGMTVTDVPGIDAYGGEKDDAIAEDAATYADLILFMITAGQPESTEADWLVKLKRMDKPIICVCNFKQSIDDETRMKRLLMHPERLQERMNISGMQEQFNTFIHEQLPNERVEFFVTHLLAKFYSQQKEYVELKDKLEDISRFRMVEKAITKEVVFHGVLHRKKSYLSIIDTPLYDQMNDLFEFSSRAYSQYLLIRDKLEAFNNWCDSFNNNQKEKLENIVTMKYNDLRNSVLAFVERNIEEDNLNDKWESHCERYKLKEEFDKAIKLSKEKLENKISDLFSDLQSEMKINLDINNKTSLGKYSFTDWKKRIKWAGAISSAVIFCMSAPIILAASIGLLFMGISWLFSSRIDKLQKKRKELREKLESEIEKAERKTQRDIKKLFGIEGFLKTEDQVKERLNLLSKSMLSLSCAERELALGYCENHRNITKQIVNNILDSMNIAVEDKKKVKYAVRVPGRRLTLVLEGNEKLNFKYRDLASRLGNSETVNVIHLDVSRPEYSQINFFFKYFGFCKPEIKKVNRGKQTVAYIRNDNFTREKIDSLNLIQQIMKIHIIIK